MKTTEREDKRLAVWKPLRRGDRVKVRARYRRGYVGTVRDVLTRGPDEPMNGYRLYGVELPGVGVADFCRFELSRQPKGRG